MEAIGGGGEEARNVAFKLIVKPFNTIFTSSYRIQNRKVILVLNFFY
jgi:hypothetical protein